MAPVLHLSASKGAHAAKDAHPSTRRDRDPQTTNSWFSLRSLRGKLQLFALLLIVVPGVLLALIAYESARAGLERTAARQLTEVAHDTLDQILAALGDAQKDVRAWARQDVMRDLVIGDLDKRVARFLGSLTDGGAPFVALVAVDHTGRPVAASDPRWLAIGGADDAIRAALAGGEVRGEPAALGASGTVAAEIAVPIRDPERADAILGALVGYYDWKAAVTMAERIRKSLVPHGLTLDLAVLDRAGDVIAEAFAEGTADPAALHAAAEALGRGLDPHERRGFRTLHAEQVLAGYERAEGDLAWVAIAMEPLARALAPVYAMRRRVVAALVAVLVGGLTIATAWAARLSRPLRQLTRATQEIARAGEVPRPVSVRSHDEIGTLAASFNAMAAALARAQEDLLVAAKFAFIGEVAAGIAHEVRTPLGIMRGSAQMLTLTVPPGYPKCTELAEMIVGEVDRLDRVVAGLLELARPREPSFEPTRLAAVLARALDFLEGQARDKAITLRRALDPSLPPARCDPEQMYQVALNLVLNALQVVPHGGHVTVRTIRVPGPKVGFEVADDGPGIPADLHDRIFTPFFSRREGGTGLGLALVQRMVQAHQGVVTLESEVGRGATFRVVLPVAERAA